MASLGLSLRLDVIKYKLATVLQTGLQLWHKFTAGTWTGSPSRMAETQGHLGIVYAVQDRADQAEAALILALQINTTLNRKAHQADNYGNLANLYWSQGLLSEAGSCYDKSLSLFREIGNHAKTCKVLELRYSLKKTQP